MQVVLRTLYICLFGLVSCFLGAQEFPPISNYSINDYGGENQNWAITQSDDKLIYAANNKGLLEFNGARWNLYSSPNESIVRSVKAVGNRIYSGCYMEFGYWEKDRFDNLIYTSLSQQIKNELIEDEEFWGIIALDNFVLFQSLDRIYIFDIEKTTFRTIDAITRITKIFTVNDQIYFHRANQGLFEIKNGKAVLVSDHEIVRDNIVINMFDHNNLLLIQTQEAGIFVLNDSNLRKWNIPGDFVLSRANVYNSIKLNDGSFAFGTVSHGLIHMTKDGIINYEINKNNGLNNNTVLSLFEDSYQNIWLGLDNGIDCINMKSPIKVYNDRNDNLGTVYASATFNDKLYLGTNQGLFYKTLEEEDNFKFVEGTSGQVWCLVNYNDRLLCGHNSGTFVINDQGATKISDIQGTWNINRMMNTNNYLLQGHYNGLSVLEFQNNQWVFKNKIEGFDISSRYYEFLSENEIIVSHEYKGVFKVLVDSSFSRVINTKKDSVNKSLHSGLVKYNNDVLYSSKEGIYKFNS